MGCFLWHDDSGKLEVAYYSDDEEEGGENGEDNDAIILNIGVIGTGSSAARLFGASGGLFVDNAASTWFFGCSHGTPLPSYCDGSA